MHENEPHFFIRDIPVFGNAILAPMAGYADVPQRALCRSFGSAVQYTEFVAAEELLARNKRAWALLDYKKGEEYPMVFQIFSNSAERLLAAAEKIMVLEPDIIDINMGCSTRRVSGRGAGVGMMRTPAEVAKTFELLTKHLPVPITGKIRLGWNGAENYLEIGRIMQESGASLVAIHPRTKEQKYKGEARWDAIAELAQALTIPVIGNGDVNTADDIDAMLNHTGCAAVMIGRGAIGNPWIFARKSRSDLTPSQFIAMIRMHIDEMVAYYGDRGAVQFRKHLKKYVAHLDLAPESLRSLVTAPSLEAFHVRLDQVSAEITRNWSQQLQLAPL